MVFCSYICRITVSKVCLLFISACSGSSCWYLSFNSFTVYIHCLKTTVLTDLIPVHPEVEQLLLPSKCSTDRCPVGVSVFTVINPCEAQLFQCRAESMSLTHTPHCVTQHAAAGGFKGNLWCRSRRLRAESSAIKHIQTASVSMFYIKTKNPSTSLMSNHLVLSCF